MILDRKTPPIVKINNQVDFLKAETISCENGVPIHFINYGEQEVIRLQLVFDAGTVFQSKSLLASSANKMLLEGTAKYNSYEISNFIEERGAFIQAETEADTAMISVYCLTKNVEEILPLLEEVILNASFPEQELENYLSIKSQNFSVNSEKVGFIAKNNFLVSLFGKNNPYASRLEQSDFKKLEWSDLIEFYKRFYQNGNLSIFLAGKVNSTILKQVEQVFGATSFKNEEKDSNLDFSIDGIQQSELKIEKKDALQNAIRIGKPMISKSHPDFPALFFTNTILGGYFGSRLMSNIREDKGYTYGIGSGLISYKNIGYFVISTEVGAEVSDATLKEIELEVNKICTDKVDSREMNLVKNYLRGSILKSFDGAFASMDRFRSLQSLNLNYNYYENLISEIMKMDSQLVLETAQKYLNYNSFKKIIVGKV